MSTDIVHAIHIQNTCICIYILNVDRIIIIIITTRTTSAIRIEIYEADDYSVANMNVIVVR